MVVWKMPTFLMSRRLTVEHSYSKKMLESGDNQIKKKYVEFFLVLVLLLIEGAKENQPMRYNPTTFRCKFEISKRDQEKMKHFAPGPFSKKMCHI